MEQSVNLLVALFFNIDPCQGRVFWVYCGHIIIIIIIIIVLTLVTGLFIIWLIILSVVIAKLFAKFFSNGNKAKMKLNLKYLIVFRQLTEINW